MIELSELMCGRMKERGDREKERGDREGERGDREGERKRSVECLSLRSLIIIRREDSNVTTLAYIL
jgi:hypothetical protein